MKPSLYYDDKCPLCRREIAILRRFCQQKLDFVAVHTLSSAENMDRELFLRVLHLRLENGVWLTGLDATAHVWSFTPYCTAFKLLRTWPARPVADWCYAKWARRRYKKRYECHVCTREG